MSPTLIAISWVLLALATLLGLRLAASAARSRSLPDALMATFFLFGGTLGYGSELAKRSFTDASPALLALWHQSAATGLAVPAIAIVVFTWRVFRPRDGWARSLAIVLATLIALCHVLGVWVAAIADLPAALRFDPGSALFWTTSTARALCFGWAGAEALRYWRLSRRRLALGLADPVVTNRFLLWALWSGSAAAILVVRVASNVLIDAAERAVSVPLPVVLGQMIPGVVCFGAIWLTFSPPAGYRRLLIRA